MNAEQWDRSLLYRFRARLVRVVDGDGVIVSADLGFRARYEPSLRLARIDAPERDTKEGWLAWSALADTIGGITRWTEGWPLRVLTVQREASVAETMSFERWVAEVFAADRDGALTNVSDAMVTAGHATYRPGAGPWTDGG